MFKCCATANNKKISIGNDKDERKAGCSIF